MKSNIKDYETFLLESSDLNDPQDWKFKGDVTKDDKRIFVYHIFTENGNMYTCEISNNLKQDSEVFDVGFDSFFKSKQDTNFFEVNKLLSTVYAIIKDFVEKESPTHLRFVTLKTDGDPDGKKRYTYYKILCNKKINDVIPEKFYTKTEDDKTKTIDIIISSDFYKN